MLYHEFEVYSLKKGNVEMREKENRREYFSK
jgi:hypothetical protein